MKVKTEYGEIDILKCIYKITLVNGNVFKKTITGYLSTCILNGDLQVTQGSEFSSRIAGEWSSCEADCGTTLNSKHIVSVKIESTKPEIIKYAKISRDSFWSSSTEYWVGNEQI